MLKKILIGFLVFISFFSCVYALTEVEKKHGIMVEGGGCSLGICNDKNGNIVGSMEEVEKANKKIDEAAKAAHDNACEESKNCIEEPSFMINVGNFSPIGSNLSGTSSKESLNILLGTTIQKLTIAIGVLALLIMTIGGGFMIFYHGDDSLLSKGKSIFIAGITALVISLGSYLIVAFVRYILYA